MSRAPARVTPDWPPRMPTDLAAMYVGEKSVSGFLSRVGKEYPRPVIDRGRRKIWLRSDLDRAIGLSPLEQPIVDAAEVL